MPTWLQVRFGATTGAAPIFLGLVKLALGLLFGSSLFLLLQSFPQPLMGGSGGGGGAREGVVGWGWMELDRAGGEVWPG